MIQQEGRHIHLFSPVPPVSRHFMQETFSPWTAQQKIWVCYSRILTNTFKLVCPPGFSNWSHKFDNQPRPCDRLERVYPFTLHLHHLPGYHPLHHHLGPPVLGKITSRRERWWCVFENLNTFDACNGCSWLSAAQHFFLRFIACFPQPMWWAVGVGGQTNKNIIF